MKTNLEKYLSNSNWLFARSGYNPKDQNVEESLFSLANGYFGSRGILEENPQGSKAGTFLSALRVQIESLSINPSLPSSWKKLSFKINYRGKEKRITIKT